MSMNPNINPYYNNIEEEGVVPTTPPSTNLVIPNQTLQGQVELNTNSEPIVLEGYQDQPDKQYTLGGFIKNNLEGATNLAAGLYDTGRHPIENIVNPLKEWGQETGSNLYNEMTTTGGFPIKATAKAGGDILSTFITRPITGMEVVDMIEHPENIVQDTADYLYEGGTPAAALTVFAPQVSRGLAKGVGKVAKSVDESILGGAGSQALSGKWMDNISQLDWVNPNVRKAMSEVMAAGIVDKMGMKVAKNKFINATQKMIDKNKISVEDFKNITRAAEELGVNTLNPKEAAIWKQFKPILDGYNEMVNKYKSSAVPKNMLEIGQRGQRLAEGNGIPITYEDALAMYQNQGLFDYGQIITKDGKALTYPKVKGEFSLDEFLELKDMLKDKKPLDLRNTKFVIPEENLGKLAQRALQDPLAKEFLDSYRMSETDLLKPIPHGHAAVDKSVGNVSPSSQRINQLRPELSKRGYGNASYEDIAKELMNPDSYFESVIEDLSRDATIEYMANKRTPILSERALPQDIRYVHKDMLGNVKNLDSLIRKNSIFKELPKGANPNDYIPMDVYTLKAFKELFYPRSANVKIPKFVKDLTRISKQALLMPGTYLFGNFIGGLKNMITSSNINLMEDITNAIRTGGQLIHDMGIERPMPNVNSARGYYQITKSWERAMNKYFGAHIVKSIDAKMQNMYAEIAAHNALRRRGVPFEQRNFNWIKNNLTEKEILDTVERIQDTALVFGERTWLPPVVLDTMEIGHNFVRWLDQAAKSSYRQLKEHPYASYINGAVLGNLAWDRNLDRALGLNISNPQSGKMYRMGADGNPKATETEVTPELTTLKLLRDPLQLLMDTQTNASVVTLLGVLNPQDSRGNLKQRKDWGNILPDFRKNVRYEDGMIQKYNKGDEIVKSLFRVSGPGRIINSDIIPAAGVISNTPVYQPYNDQFLVGEEGNPLKPIGKEELLNRVFNTYEHSVYPGEDDIIAPKTEGSLLKSLNRRQGKTRAFGEDIARQRGLGE